MPHLRQFGIPGLLEVEGQIQPSTKFRSKGIKALRSEFRRVIHFLERNIFPRQGDVHDVHCIEKIANVCMSR
jgi:hypothetical protein